MTGVTGVADQAAAGMTREDRRAALAAAGATLLGSFALLPVFSTTAWLRPVLAVVLVVYGTGLLLRRVGPALWARLRAGRPVPRWLGAIGLLAVPALQVGAVLCVLTLFYAPADAVATALPTGESMADLVSVLSEGSAELREQATPALPLTGLVALTTVLVGLIAVAIDLIAVAGRQAGLAGLGLLGLYCVPVSTVTGSIGLAALVAPGAGFALLLWADQRRRLAGADRATARATSGTGSRALRIGVLAMAAGVLLGSVVPTLPEGSFGTGLGGGTGPGGTVGTALDPVAELQGQLTLPEPTDLMTVEADAPDLGHLRAVVLDEYDVENGWAMSNLDGELSVAEPELSPLPEGQTRRQVVARFTARGHDDRFMPVLWSPLAVQVPDPENWRFDPSTGTVFGRDTTTERRTWVVVADQPEPSPALLQDAPGLDPADPVQQRFTELPELDGSVTALVTELVAGAQTPYERVRRIHDYLTDRDNGFIYSLSTAPGTSDDDLVNFLRLKRGYCEQYAGAMAVMVRAAGVPARVALGYTPGEVQSDGSRLVTTDDAHAWVEVYFGGLGWVPFDPTPIAADRSVALPWAPRASDGPDGTPGSPSEPSAAPTAAPTARADRGATAIPELGGTDAATSWVRPVAMGAAATLALALLLAVPATARAVQRRRRMHADDPRELWDELTATVQDLRLPTDPSWTPRETARRLAGEAGHVPDALVAERVEQSVLRLALAEEAATYGRSAAVDPEQVDVLRAALRTARRGLQHAVPRRVRWWAVLWPASLRTSLGERVVDGARQLGERFRRSRTA